jgi:hypothetical protein
MFSFKNLVKLTTSFSYANRFICPISNKAVLLVNSNPVDQHLMKPFNKYIKLYKELGVKNVLYTQTPEYYIFNNSIEKTPLMRKDKMEEYIEEFLPIIPQEQSF